MKRHNNAMTKDMQKALGFRTVTMSASAAITTSTDNGGLVLIGLRHVGSKGDGTMIALDLDSAQSFAAGIMQAAMKLRPGLAQMVKAETEEVCAP